MKVNVGGADCILRIAAGLVLIGLTLAGNIGIWGWIGLIFLALTASKALARSSGVLSVLILSLSPSTSSVHSLILVGSIFMLESVA